MLTYEEIQTLNDLEFEVHNYILKNRERVLGMKIRELAEEAHISTTTILRYCKKMGCSGYAEFKTKLKMLELEREEELDEDVNPVLEYLKKMNMKEKSEQLQDAVEMMSQAKRIVFMGTGTSGITAKYGARYFTGLGKQAIHIDDPYYPFVEEDCSDMVVVALSVSGETDFVVYRINHFRRWNAKIIAITNTDNNTIARMADISLSYYVPEMKVYLFNGTTQMPAIFLIETMGRRLHKLLRQEAGEGHYFRTIPT